MQTLHTDCFAPGGCRPQTSALDPQPPDEPGHGGTGARGHGGTGARGQGGAHADHTVHKWRGRGGDLRTIVYLVHSWGIESEMVPANLMRPWPWPRLITNSLSSSACWRSPSYRYTVLSVCVTSAIVGYDMALNCSQMEGYHPQSTSPTRTNVSDSSAVWLPAAAACSSTKTCATLVMTSSASLHRSHQSVLKWISQSNWTGPCGYTTRWSNSKGVSAAIGDTPLFTPSASATSTSSASPSASASASASASSASSSSSSPYSS